MTPSTDSAVDEPAVAARLEASDALHPSGASGSVADLEIEARIHFGAREMTLEDLLALAAGDVLELDRNVSDPVDLVIGDKVVARGEVVLVGGNFALQVREVMAPRPRLETVRCLT